MPIEFSTSLRPTAANTRISGATAQGVIVWAVDEVGSGRVAYSADSQMLGQEAGDCGFWEWLGGRTAPRVLGTGFFHCMEQEWNGLGSLENFTYEVALPAQYVGDPAALRADYDVVLFCVSNWGNAPPVEAQTYVDYVAVHGGGLYLAAIGQPLEPKDEIDRINEIAAPLGVEFQKDDLQWEGAAVVDFACFPR